MFNFKSLLNSIKGNVSAFTSAPIAKAAIGASLYVAKSNGMSDKEFDAVVEQIEGNPRFANIDVDAIIADWEGYKSARLMKRDLINLLASLKDTTSKPVREDVIITAIEVADAEDGIDDGEMNCLRELGTAIGINVDALI